MAGLTRAERPPAPAPRKAWTSRAGSWILPIFTGLAVLYLFLPIAVMIAFGFNDPAGRFNFTWQGFTLHNYATIFRFPQLTEALINSLIVATISTVVATTLGTLIGLALTRYDFRGRGPLNLLVFVPVATPEIVLGAALLAFYVSVGLARGLSTVIIAHIMFNISFVVITIRARLTGFDRRLEEAAMDLGANEWATFRKVTFPLIFPGVLAAALLAFALSIDDFVITLFTAGQATTFPLWVYGVSRFGVPPQVNVMGTIIFAIALVFIGLQIWMQRRAIVSAAPTRTDR
ncbi:MAG TPA: ABC transporter permease [Candidatus Limnocylindrales bacterium]|jgi:spermidine/putrescine transport system permease protein|nr:ABC transporter permease [Candidatus Limnocylindrales bacterium]